MYSPVIPTLLSVVAVSLLSLIGAVLFSINDRFFKKILLYLVGFSAGTLLGGVFIHIIPEMAEDGDFFSKGLFLILFGILLSFVIEKIIHWKHCHILPTKEHHHSVGTMSLIGDGLHNLVDGMIIAGSFLVSVPLGFATTAAVIFHEIPQEIGDFALLIFSGFSRKKALLFNLLSASTAIVGAVFILLTSHFIPFIGNYLLAFAAGNFLYIAVADLIPELHRETRPTYAALQLLWIIGGILVMYGLTFIEFA